MKQRIFVKKKQGFQIEAQALLEQLHTVLNIQSIKKVEIYNVYDVFHATSEDIQLLKENVLAEVVLDEVFDTIDLKDKTYLAYESLPGQFDQRSSSAEECLTLLNNKQGVVIKSAKLVVMDGEIDTDTYKRIEKYLINPVEMQVKDLSVLQYDEDVTIESVAIVKHFREFSIEALKEYRKNMGLAMSQADLEFVQTYFINEKRDPTECEIRVLDTYWSDHCRHTTFETILQSVVIKQGMFQERIQAAYDLFLDLNTRFNKDKPITLMNMATIGGKSMRMMRLLDDLEVSDEVNACSIEVKVDVDGVVEDYLIMFKNETHNHPTEIEPFGGASTCIGGAIRDPLSGRSYVYQAMRVSGAGDITKDIQDTLPNKLPQSVISKGAAHGYSSYGNQIGLATTFVKEIYDEGYVAKRMEVGAVVGAAKKTNVVRAKPAVNDIVVLLGGATGRDGIGGATGSSVAHDAKSIEKSSEVQKGNAIIERKLQRLFRNPECTKLIKKANDFGAGGVSVAIGELADGIHIDLDKVPTKYAGLSGVELAISESQERMAVVIDPSNYDSFKRIVNEENLEAHIVATISGDRRLQMHYQNELIVDISRDFLDTNGTKSYQDVEVMDYTGIEANPFINKDTNVLENLKDANVASQRGMVEMFDATIGRSTVVMPYGGKYQLSEQEASIQKVAVDGYTNTTTLLTYGFQSEISKYSPYLGGSYSVVEALTRLVASGASYQQARLSCQEYFERLDQNKQAWGKPTQALLGLLEAQYAFKTPAIGGKDSMSGTYNDIHVPPTLITFALTLEKVDAIITSEFKQANSYIYLVKHTPNEDGSPNYNMLIKNFDVVKAHVDNNTIISAMSVKQGGISACLCKMSFGNRIGVTVDTTEALYTLAVGSIIVEATSEINVPNFIRIGTTNASNVLSINKEEITILDAIEAWEERYQKIYPYYTDEHSGVIQSPTYMVEKPNKAKQLFDKPKVLIAVFPGNNCEYDSEKAFKKAGAETEIFIFNNITIEDTKQSLLTLSKKLKEVQIFMIPGGFSSGDEPDGSGKYIANVLRNKEVNEGIQTLLKNDGLIIGICNGFQALIKAGLLPYGNVDRIDKSSPTLFKNNINRHVSRMAQTRVTSNKSPWLSGFNAGEIHTVALSHGEGKFVVSEELAKQLFENGQVATQYVDFDGNPTMNGTFNLNGSSFAIEGITSLDGKIFGKMGHSERYEEGLMKNIYGNKMQDIFMNGVNYFKK